MTPLRRPGFRFLLEVDGVELPAKLAPYKDLRPIVIVGTPPASTRVDGSLRIEPFVLHRDVVDAEVLAVVERSLPPAPGFEDLVVAYDRFELLYETPPCAGAAPRLPRPELTRLPGPSFRERLLRVAILAAIARPR